MFLEISQNSLENTCARVSFLICNFIKRVTLAQLFSSKFCEISKNTFSYRTPSVAAPVVYKETYYGFPLKTTVKSDITAAIKVYYDIFTILSIQFNYQIGRIMFGKCLLSYCYLISPTSWDQRVLLNHDVLI